MAKMKRVRRDITEAERDTLQRLLDAVPKVVAVRNDWTSPEGQAFLAEARRVYISGGTINQMTKALEGVAGNAIQAAMTHKRAASKKRPPRANNGKEQS